ncbi:MAG TPA: hypothetical protein VHI52_14470, partial [Verrucomicrobiae bacterium]|nr:hypothetical protein [Verrucomicrobiae bacterium]
RATEITLSGFAPRAYLSTVMKTPVVQAILLSSSDFSRVKVKNHTQGTKDRIVDVTRFWNERQPLRDDAWLHDGDVVEVPDRP